MAYDDHPEEDLRTVAGGGIRRLEDGKSYKTRDGIETFTVCLTRSELYPFSVKTDFDYSRYFWREDGFFVSPSKPKSLDLVEEDLS